MRKSNAIAKNPKLENIVQTQKQRLYEFHIGQIDFIFQEFPKLENFEVLIRAYSVSETEADYTVYLTYINDRSVSLRDYASDEFNVKEQAAVQGFVSPEQLIVLRHYVDALVDGQFWFTHPKFMHHIRFEKTGKVLGFPRVDLFNKNKIYHADNLKKALGDKSMYT